MDELELMEKAKELKSLQVKQDEIRLENSMLSEHLSRIVTRKGSLQLHFEKLEEEEAEKEEEEAAETIRRTSRRSFRIFHDAPAGPRATVRFKSPARSSPPDAKAAARPQAVPMSVEEKCEIVEEECNALNEQVEKLRADNDRTLDDLRAVFKEAHRGISETRKEKNSFNREVVVLAEINPKHKIFTEDVLRYLQDKLRKKRTVRDKLQEKIDLLHMEIMEAEHQFTTKKDLKDILHAIDFDQVSIQNMQLHARIRDRIQDLWELKDTTKKATKFLESTRRKLAFSLEEGIRIRRCLGDRRPLLTTIQDNIALEQKQKRKLNEAFILSLQEEDGPPQPRVMDYMRCRTQAAALLKELKTWNTKVEIAELTHIQLNKMIKQIQKPGSLLSESTVRPESAVLVS